MSQRSVGKELKLMLSGRKSDSQHPHGRVQ